MMNQVLVRGQSVDVQPIWRKLYEERNLDISLLEPDIVEKVLSAHLSAAELTDPDEYAELLDEDESECQSLVEDLLAPPERFFADPLLTSLLNDDILPSIVAAKRPDEPVRVWIPNCAQGHLAYDVALMLQKLRGDRADPRTVRVIAGLKDEAAANQARSRDYPEERFRELKKAWPHLGNADQALRRARSLILFGAHHLLTQTPYSGIDLVICVGYLPLLQPAERELAAGKLIHSLFVQGILVLGRGEGPPMGAPSPTEDQPFGVFRKQVSHPYELKRTLIAARNLILSPADLLDGFADPVIVVARNGAIIAANQPAVQRFSADGSFERAFLQDLTARDLAFRVHRAVEGVVQTGLSPTTVEGQDWTAGVARITRSAVGAAAAIAFIAKPLCEGQPSAPRQDYAEACRDRALKTADLSAQVWVRERHLQDLTTQASVMTENLYNRNQLLASMSNEIAKRNLELQETNEQLRQAIADRARIEEDLRRAFDREHHIADTLQGALLPELAESVDGYSVAVKYQAAAGEAEVGGDFYHGGMIDQNRYLLALGDVAGKGLEAAVLGAMTKYMLMGFSAESPDPGILLLRLNEALIAQSCDTDFAFVTLACALVDLPSHKVYYASAGHEPAILYRGAMQKPELLEPTGRALGIIGGNKYPVREVAMAPGDSLLLYTDGLSDAGVPRNPLGIEGLVRVVSDSASLTPPGLLEAIHEAALERGGGRLRDDAASLLLKREV